MRNPENRELSTQLYRWMEQHEYPPKINDSDEAVAYFTQAWKDLEKIVNACPRSEWATMLAIGYYQALEERFKEVQKLPTV